MTDVAFFYFFISFCGSTGNLFQTSDDSARGFHSQDGFIVTCALLSLVCNNATSNLWLLGPGIEPASLTCEDRARYSFLANQNLPLSLYR